ncbi:unknown [Clostridium sp. CAG:299]|nr:unknown [Clostridium sp. CAG:299]
MLNANTDMFVREPPVIELRKPNASLLYLANSSSKKLVFAPGIGICDPIRNTISIIKVYTSFCLTSFTLKAFWSVFNILDHLAGSANSLDFGFCSFTYCIYFYSELLCELAVSENLNAVARILNDTCFD